MKKTSCLSILFLSLNAIANNSIDLHVDRLHSNLKSLAIFGATSQKGTSRIAYSESDKSGREWILAEMKKAGLSTVIDAAGNIVGTLPGTDQNLKALARMI